MRSSKTILSLVLCGAFSLSIAPNMAQADQKPAEKGISPGKPAGNGKSGKPKGKPEKIITDKEKGPETC